MTARWSSINHSTSLRAVTAPPAVGGDAEVAHEALGRDDARLGAGDAVGRVEQPEVELGLGAQSQTGRASRRTGRRRGRSSTGRWIQSSGPAEAERQGVRDLDQWLCVVRPLAVVALVTVTEVVAELYAGRDAPTEANEALDDARPRVVEPRRHDAVEHGELEVRVPLHGELVVRDRTEDRVQLVHHPRLVERLDASLVLGGDERGDRSERSRQRDLEPAVDRNQTVTLAPGEDPVRRDGRRGVAEVLETERVERLTVA